jgi:hypothetical protein
MKKNLLYVVFNLLGVIIGLFIGVKWLGDKTIYNGSIRIKQRGKGNVQKPEIVVKIEDKPRRIERLQGRLEKKKARIARRLERKL